MNTSAPNNFNTPIKNIVGAANQTPRKMADFKSEIFFIGQVVGGSDFPTDLDGLFVEASLKYGAENWQLLSEKQSAL